MKITIVAVGQKMPAWVDVAIADYLKRFPADFKPVLRTVKAEPRSGKTPAQLMAAERLRIEAAIPNGSQVVALDERGKGWSTRTLATQLQGWQDECLECTWLIGGPDGLDPALKQQAHALVKLSDLTLPHAMVRVLLIEQLYRAWSLMANHPYHRD